MILDTYAPTQSRCLQNAVRLSLANQSMADRIAQLEKAIAKLDERDQPDGD